MSELNSTVASSVSYPKAEFKSTSSLNKSFLSSCRICLSSIFNPVSLGCGHRFCEKCLDKYWHVREKPDFIVCPLCRTWAFKVDFAQKEEVSSTQDFRKMFNQPIASESTSATVLSERALVGSLLCLKLSILMPTIYFLAKLLRSPLISFISFFSDLVLALVYLI